MQQQTEMFIPWDGPRKQSRVAHNILRKASKLSIDFRLIEPDDRILVAVSGGKDSYVLLWTLHEICRKLPFSVTVEAINIDMGFGGFDQKSIGTFLQRQGIPVHLIQETVGDICREKMGDDENACWLCARFRRGILYKQADFLGFNKIALGHHADDVIETLIINQVFAGQLKAMPPRLLADDGHSRVIRPLARVFERDIMTVSKEIKVPIVGCNCQYGCNLMRSERSEAKALLTRLEKRIPDIKNNLLASLTRVKPSHLWDRTLFDFEKKT